MAKNKNETPEVEAEVEGTEETFDLTSFNEAVADAVAEADQTTGTVADAQVDKVRTAYNELPGIKAKNAAKGQLQELLKSYLGDLNSVSARAVMQLTTEAAVASKSGTTARKEVDPTEAYQATLTQLTLALFLAQHQVPEGVDGSAVSEAASAAASELFSQAVTVLDSEDQDTDNSVIRNAIRLATTKARKQRVSTGERRDLGAHISEAVNAAESGAFLSVADIRKFESTVYGTDHPSAGAISNRLQPKSGNPTTIPGITVEVRDGKLGAVVA